MNQKATVLVVEDEINLLEGFRDILELDDYRVLTAPNGVEGLKLLHQDSDNPPDVIVSDIMMPYMDGYTFLEEVRKEDRWVTVPFIFLTARSDSTDRHKGSRLGADVYLTKPCDAPDLLVAVASQIKRKRNIKRVQESQMGDLKKRILTLLNHEFRTPLTLVVAYAEMLKEFNTENMSADEVMSFLKGVNSGADRLRRLVENFITLLEIQEGDAAKTYAWRRQPISEIKPYIADAHRQIAQPDQRPREFVFDIADDLPTFVGDATFLTIAIRELLDNAAKFSVDHGRVELCVYSEGDEIVLTVQDWGRGIPEEEIENIWRELYQVNREHFEDQGSGTGLAIVDGIVRIHGGSRSVESALDRGSLFTVRLPVQQPPVEETTTSQPASHSQHVTS